MDAPGEVPSGRSSLVAQVHENSLYVFGGYNGQVVLNDFYEYRFEPLNIPGPTLINDLRSLINNRELSDVTFIVDGFPVYASRAHLAVRSEHFRAMLYGGMRESQSEEIEIKDVSHPVFLKMLEFLYTDTVEDIPYEIAVQLLMASEQYLLDRLKALCEDSIRKSITVDNVISVFMAAHRHRAEGLKEIGLEFILDHLEDVKMSTGFQLLKAEPDLLMEIIMKS
uniref:BTB domain-containing protein n=1 Tax=Fibrocapsa japonica TaxID=94617 RepID=A0A7S2UT53_9STRA